MKLKTDDSKPLSRTEHALKLVFEKHRDVFHAAGIVGISAATLKRAIAKQRRPYRRDVFESLVEHFDRWHRSASGKIRWAKDICDDLELRIDDEGVWTAVDLHPGYLSTAELNLLWWTPLCETADEPGSPDPLSNPSLPFPFSAGELAAFMIDGPGEVLRMDFGAWDLGRSKHGDERWSEFPAREEKRVLTKACRAFHDAESAVGSLDAALQDDVRNGVAHPGPAYLVWRKQMVRKLLEPRQAQERGTSILPD